MCHKTKANHTNHDKFMLKLPQPFLLWKARSVYICLENTEKSYFFLFDKNKFSIKKQKQNRVLGELSESTTGRSLSMLGLNQYKFDFLEINWFPEKKKLFNCKRK